MGAISSSFCGHGHRSQSPSPKRKPAGRELRRKTFGYGDARAKGEELRTLGSNRAGGGDLLFSLFYRFFLGAIFLIGVGTVVLIALVVVVVALGI